MAARSFVQESQLGDGGLALALAPALTPDGIAASPSFFHGFATQPQVLAHGLLTLADVTATRYFNYTPTSLRDPVLTAHGDRLRAECFSACNGVYARLDLLASGFDGGDIARGTTNVDISPATRSALTRVGRTELLHLDVGNDGLTVSSMRETSAERPVAMPDRWVAALGNAAELHRDLVPLVRLPRPAARTFLASLPAATGKTRSGWLTQTSTGARLAGRASGPSVHLSGLHRLSAAKRLLPHVGGLTAYGPADGTAGAALVELDLPGARLALGLTSEAWRGHSGEGSLLVELASPDVAEDADLVSALLAFEPDISVPRLVADSALDEGRVRGAIAVLASSGRIGWDPYDSTYFHRELPDDPNRVAKNNPRLRAANRLVEEGAVSVGDAADRWNVRSRDVTYTVRYSGNTDDARCTCTWYLRHAGGGQSRRGPCKHVLAVQFVARGRR